eukprot:scaffold648762_cov50-Prasinocladus_malaysianus.AAC.1
MPQTTLRLQRGSTRAKPPFQCRSSPGGLSATMYPTSRETIRKPSRSAHHLTISLVSTLLRIQPSQTTFSFFRL